MNTSDMHSLQMMEKRYFCFVLVDDAVVNVATFSKAFLFHTIIRIYGCMRIEKRRPALIIANCNIFNTKFFFSVAESETEKNVSWDYKQNIFVYVQIKSSRIRFLRTRIDSNSNFYSHTLMSQWIRSCHSDKKNDVYTLQL